MNPCQYLLSGVVFTNLFGVVICPCHVFIPKQCIMIDVSHLSKWYGDVQALKDVSFSIKQGEIVGFLGPNGAGKSTTMKILTGFMYPSEGEVEIAGINVLKNDLEAKKHIGYLPENNPLYFDFTVEEFFEYHAGMRELRGAKKNAAIEYAVSSCNLESVYYKSIGALSKGLKQRVGLGQAILHQPDILILDEPTSGLDPRQTVEIRDLLKHLGKEHTILFSTHIMQEVEAICSRVIIISKGEIVAEGNPVDLQSGPKMAKGEMRMHIVLASSQKDAESLFGSKYTVEKIETVKRGEVTATVHVESSIKARQELFSYLSSKKAPLLAAIPQETNLEEIFLELTS